MLRKILSITGKSGLFEILSQGKNTIIVEDIATKKRFPAMARDHIVSLGDIAMYTDSGDKPLGEILDAVYAKNDGKAIDVAALIKDKKLKEEFGGIIVDFDRERVHDSDIKKLFSWYNLLLAAGWTKFTAEDEEEKSAEEK